MARSYGFLRSAGRLPVLGRTAREWKRLCEALAKLDGVPASAPTADFLR